jgi:hypothetical protein
MGKVRKDRSQGKPAADSNSNGRRRRQADNGQADTDQDRHDADQLKKALETPGVVEIPETKPNPGPVPVLEIPTARLDVDADEAGNPLPVDPALLVAKIDRPSPHGWIRLFVDHVLETTLLSYQPIRNRTGEYLYVIPELQAPLREHMRQVRVTLVFDLAANEPFLWITPESDLSPYHNALMRIFSQPPEFIATHKFLIGKCDPKGKKCKLKSNPLGPNDPEPILPSRPLGKLLAEALGAERIINSTGHPTYQALMTGGTIS